MRRGGNGVDIPNHTLLEQCARRIGDRPPYLAGPRACAAIAIVVGLVCLCGWAFDAPSLTSVVPGAVQMKANTAVCLVLCGAALWILGQSASTRGMRLAQTLGAGGGAIALLTLTEYLWGSNWGVDELLTLDTVDAYNLHHGRMSPASALALLATAGALCALPHPRFQGLSRWGAAASMIIGLVTLLGYLWNADAIVTDHVLPPMALNTGLCFALLGGGILLVARTPGDFADRALYAALERRILAGFVVALSLVLAGGAYTYRTSMQFADSVEWVAHTQEVRASLALLDGAISGAEIALRAYVLTGGESHHDEYGSRLDETRQQLARVRELTANSPEHGENLAALGAAIDARVGALASALQAFEDAGRDAARTAMVHERLGDSSYRVHELTRRMASIEAAAQGARRAAGSHVREAALLSLLATLALAGGIFAALFRGIRREMLARREAEAALRASEENNRSIVHSSPDCLCVLTLDGRLQQMTPRGCRLMEIDDFATVAGLDWLKLWSTAEQAAAAAAVDAARHGKDGRFQGRCPTRKGADKWWDVIVMPVLDPLGRPERLLAVARDSTELKRSAAELLEANRFLDSLIENLPVMVVVKDAASLRYLRVNRACERQLGVPREEMLGKTAADVFNAQDAAESRTSDLDALARRRLIELDEQRIHTDRLGVRTFHTMKLPIGDQQDRPQFLLSISVDVTERKLAEQAICELNAALEAKASQLIATNRELESFSYSVSHDLRAPLRAIDGFAQMLKEDYDARLDAEGRRYIAVICENTRRMGTLIDDLLQFSRLGRLPVVAEQINVEALVREIVAEVLYEDPAAPHVRIERLPPARGDRSLLRQVWMNLISNAIKYSSKSDRPRIEVTGRCTGEETLYSIKDNGVGFDMDYADRLFGVFQRLHRADEFNGTGVGLAIVQRIVSRHGGRVWAEGTLNVGATFSFSLPQESGHG